MFACVLLDHQFLIDILDMLTTFQWPLMITQVRMILKPATTRHFIREPILKAAW
jgi:hypothetical protein